MYYNKTVLLLIVLLAVPTVFADNDSHGRRRNSVPAIVDYIVLGAGTAGSVVAARLAEDPRNKVLVIDIGNDQTGSTLTSDPTNWAAVSGSPLEWNDFSSPTEPRVRMDLTKRHITQGRTLGGSSAINSAMFVRGNRRDYNSWAEQNPGWSYDDLVPYFKGLESNPIKYATNPAFHGNSGPLYIGEGYTLNPHDQALISAAQSVGLTYNDDFNGAEQITSPHGSVGWLEYTIKENTRENAWHEFLRPKVNQNNVWLRDESFVLRINFVRKRAVSVDWIDLVTNQKYSTRARKEIVLSLGAMRSSQILRLSGVGDSAELASLGVDLVHHLPGVGKNLQDHPIATFAVIAPGLPPCAFNRTFAAKLDMFIRTKLQAPEDGRPDIQIHGISGCSFIFNLVYLLHPRSRGHVALTSRDPTARPVPQINYFADPHDLATMIEGMRRQHQILRQSPVSAIAMPVGPKNISDDASVADYILGTTSGISNTNSGNHLVGTCKMGPASDPMAVVDNRLRVHGIENLRVIDASVMPTITSGNTQAPTYAIAAKGVDMILQDNL